MQVSRFPHDTTKLFCDIFEDAETFLTEWKASGLYESGLVSDTNITKLFYLLYSRHANSAIANWDENQFKYKCWAIIYQYAPTWEKKLSVQAKLRSLDETNGLLDASRAVYNHAYAMGDDMSASDIAGGVDNIDQQNTTKLDKGIVEGYASLITLLEDDVTNTLLDRFRPLFAKFVYTSPDIFVTDLIEEDEEEEE